MDNFLEKILMNLPDVILVVDQDSRIKFVNIALGRLMQKRSRDFLGMKLEDLDVGSGNDWKVLNDELEIQKKIGFKKEFNEKRKNTVKKKEPADPLAPSLSDHSIVHPSIFFLGERTFTYQYFDICNQGENIPHIGLLMSELFAEKKLIDKLIKSENISELNTLTAGIAHEINNPLFSILGCADALMVEKDYDKIKKLSSKIQDKAKRISTIVSKLSDHSA